MRISPKLLSFFFLFIIFFYFQNIYDYSNLMASPSKNVTNVRASGAHENSYVLDKYSNIEMQILFDKSSYDYGTRCLPEGQSDLITFTLTNIGTENVTGTVSLGGLNPDQFKIWNAGSFTLEPGSSKGIVVCFAPTAPGNFNATIIASGIGLTPAYVDLKGLSYRGAELELLQLNNYSHFQFADQPINTTSNEVSFSFRNIGDRTATGVVRMDWSPVGFRIVQGEGIFTLNPGDQKTVTVVFNPSSASNYSNCLSIDGDSPINNLGVILDGKGINILKVSFDQPSYSFGEIQLGTNVSMIFKLSNTGTANVSGYINITGQYAEQFIIQGGPRSFSLEPGSSTNLVVQFNPTASGIFSAALQASGSGFESVSVGLNGSSYRGAQLAFSDMSAHKNYTFPEQLVCTKSNEAVFAFLNTGDRTATGEIRMQTGSDIFKIIEGSGPFSLNPGEQRTIKVTFTPNEVIDYSGYLYIDGATPCNNIDIFFYGRGYQISGPALYISSNNVTIEQKENLENRVVLNDPIFNASADNSTQMTTINALEALKYGTGNSQIVIAIIDNGFDVDHPDLVNAIVPGWNFVEKNGNVSPSTGSETNHGTQVAGCAAAIANNGIGIASIGSGCRIMPLKVSSDTHIEQAIKYAVDAGARVINISKLCNISYEITKYAYDRNVVIVLAAGNDGADIATRNLCSSYRCDETITVAGLKMINEPEKGYVMEESNYGNAIDVCAPGYVMTTIVGGGYGIAGGTSVASPIVAGLAGLILSQNPSLTAKDVIYLIKKSAKNIDKYNIGKEGKLGTGKIDAYKALNMLVNSIVIQNPGIQDLTVLQIKSSRTWLSFSEDPYAFFVKPRGTKVIFLNVDWYECPSTQQLVNIDILSNALYNGTFTVIANVVPDPGTKILSVIINSQTSSESSSIYKAADIKNDGTGTMPWFLTVSENEMFELQTAALGENSGSVIVKLKPNKTTSPRTGYITVTAPGALNNSQTIQIRQDAGIAFNSYKLKENNNQYLHKLGNSVTIGEQYVLAGGDEQSTDHTMPGDVFSFNKDESMSRYISSQVRLTGGVNTTNFGYSVDSYENYAIFGEYHYPYPTEYNYNSFMDNMAAHIFKLNSAGNWEKQCKIVPDDPMNMDLFGKSVSIYGQYAVVGATGYNTTGMNNKGSVYVFKKEIYYDPVTYTNIERWRQISKLTENLASPEYGQSVSIYGNDFIVGDPGANASFVYHIGGESCTKLATLTPRVPSPYGLFGSAVAISSDHAVIGAPGDNNYSGRVYVFRKPYGSNWVDLNENYTILGKNSEYSQFGKALDLKSNLLAIGAPYDNDCNSTSGAVYLCANSGSGFTHKAKFTAHDYHANINLGTSVSIFGNNVIGGAPNDFSNIYPAHSGSVYVFDFSPGQVLEKAAFSEINKLSQIKEYKLKDNYPNPFNPATIITFDLPEKSSVKIEIFDIMGNKITEILNDTKEVGSYSVKWDSTNLNGSKVSSGIYICRLCASSLISGKKIIKSNKMILMK